MTTPPDPQTTDSRPDIFDPFPEPRTVPSGWDLSEFGYGASRPDARENSHRDAMAPSAQA